MYPTRWKAFLFGVLVGFDVGVLWAIAMGGGSRDLLIAVAMVSLLMGVAFAQPTVVVRTTMIGAILGFLLGLPDVTRWKGQGNDPIRAFVKFGAVTLVGFAVGAGWERRERRKGEA